MSKRCHQEDATPEERWLRKKRKYEKKLEKQRAKRRRRNAIYSENEIEENPENDQFYALPIDIADDNYVSPVDEERECFFVYIHAAVDEEPDVPATSAAEQPPPPAAGPAADPDPGERADAGRNVNDDFDPELLRAIIDPENVPIALGDFLPDDLAVTLQRILKDGLSAEFKKELSKQYPFPANVPLAKAPTLNPEVNAALPEVCKLRDTRLQTKQEQIGHALSAIGKALSDLLKKSPDIPTVIKNLYNACKLVADSHYLETDTRCSVIIPLVDKSFTESFKSRKRDSYLFGEGLGELVKDSQGIRRTSQLIQASTSRNLNTRGSSTRAARPQRSGQTHQSRAGGPRPAAPYPYQYPHPYGRAAARRAPALPAHRRPPPPPPPPRRPPQPPAPRTAR